MDVEDTNSYNTVGTSDHSLDVMEVNESENQRIQMKTSVKGYEYANHMVFSVLKTTEISETKVKSIEMYLNIMKKLFMTEVERSDNILKNSMKRKTLSEDITEIETIDRSVSEKRINKTKKLKTSVLFANQFDRFDDHLSELILSFLSIKDKFRFECLSKQIQKLIFNKHFVFNSAIDRSIYRKLTERKPNQICPFGENVKHKEFDLCLRKLKNITDIGIHDYLIVDPRLLQSIADNCHHLRRIYFAWDSHITKESIEYFAQKRGKYLKSLAINEYNKDLTEDKLRLLLSFTPELERIRLYLSINELPMIWMKRKSKEKLFPKLETVICVFHSVENLIEFQNNYGNQIKHLKTSLRIKDITRGAMIRVMSGFGRFHSLESLHLMLTFRKTFTPKDVVMFLEQLTQLSINCFELRRLSVYMRSEVKLGFHNYLSHFLSLTSLTSLEIKRTDSLNETTFHRPFNYLKGKSQIKLLKLLDIRLSDEYFENIGQYLPQLESLKIRNRYSLTDKSLQYFSKLKHLKRLKISSFDYSSNRKTINFSVKHFLNHCLQLERLVLNTSYGKVVDISVESIEYFKQKAKQMPKRQYYLEFTNKPNDYKSCLKEMPNNLTVKLK